MTRTFSHLSVFVLLLSAWLAHASGPTSDSSDLNGLLLDAQPRLDRTIETKPKNAPASEYSIWRKYQTPLSPAPPYGIQTTVGYKIRAESIWLERLVLANGNLYSVMVFEKNEFPMDDQWDTIWETRHVFRPDTPFVHEGSIADLDYRMTITFRSTPTELFEVDSQNGE